MVRKSNSMDYFVDDIVAKLKAGSGTKDKQEIALEIKQISAILKAIKDERKVVENSLKGLSIPQATAITIGFLWFHNAVESENMQGAAHDMYMFDYFAKKYRKIAKKLEEFTEIIAGLPENETKLIRNFSALLNRESRLGFSLQGLKAEIDRDSEPTDWNDVRAKLYNIFQVPKSEIIFTRHSMANYGTYSETVAGDNPTGPHDITKQVIPDIPQKEGRDGVALAKKQARLLFGTFNKKTDAIFFVSSNEARALETAYYYASEALDLGFEVIEHKTGWFGTGVKAPHVDKVREHIQRNGKPIKRYVRPINSLSLVIPNTFEACVFNTERINSYLNYNWAKIPEAEQRKFEAARAIIKANDHGSWGANFYFHAEEIQKIFPNLETPMGLYNSQFQNILKLVKFGINKIRDAKYAKNIKVIGFGHENYWSVALDIHFKNHGIGDCQSVGISIDEGKVTLMRRGNWQSLK
jgi:hypothetical protein